MINAILFLTLNLIPKSCEEIARLHYQADVKVRVETVRRDPGEIDIYIDRFVKAGWERADALKTTEQKRFEAMTAVVRNVYLEDHWLPLNANTRTEVVAIMRDPTNSAHFLAIFGFQTEGHPTEYYRKDFRWVGSSLGLMTHRYLVAEPLSNHWFPEGYIESPGPKRLRKNAH